MKPTIGRIVHYTLDSDDVEAINRRRDDALRHGIGSDTGCQLHFGAQAHAGQVFALVVTRVWGEETTPMINGQVLLDGNDTLWVTRVPQGVGPGEWAWPPRAPE